MDTPLNHLPVVVLVGRPASGKSEIIDFLKKLEPEMRLEQYHLADLEFLDDFPMLWTWFEEDAILEKKLKKPRLHTDPQGYFKYDYLWNLLIERINLEHQKRQRDQPDISREVSLIVQFSRGTEHGGYRDAFEHLSKELLGQAGVIYVNVSFSESMRKNRRRFNPQHPDSILEHSLPDEKLERLYKQDDWPIFSQGDGQFLTIKGLRVPFVVFENDDDVTTGNLQGLSDRLRQTFEKLWQIRNSF